MRTILLALVLALTACSTSEVDPVYDTGDDGDGLPDLVAAGRLLCSGANTGWSVLFLGAQLEQGGRFASAAATAWFWGVAGGAIPTFADVDGDGRDDLLNGAPGESTAGTETGSLRVVFSPL